jgi:ABC-type histidine transport system ATPase subunit
VTDILTVKDVSFSFGDKAVLNNVSLEVQKGEIVSILGPPIKIIFVGNNVLDKPDSFRKPSPKQQRLLF